MFDKLVQALVVGVGVGYERIADASCGATTMRRRRDEWIRLGVWHRLELACPDAYDRLIGPDLEHLAVDGCTTKAPCGGECAGRSPVDRGKGGVKRSQLTDGAGIPMATVSAPASTVDHALLESTLDAVKSFSPLPADVVAHPDARYDYRPCRDALEQRGLTGGIAHRGEPAPIQVGRRWMVEPTNSCEGCSARPATTDAKVRRNDPPLTSRVGGATGAPGRPPATPVRWPTTTAAWTPSPWSEAEVRRRPAS